MIPRGKAGIDHLTTRLLNDVVPQIEDAYMMSDLAMIAEMINLIAQDFDRAADVLTTDRDDILNIFRSLSDQPELSAMKPKIAELVEPKSESLRIEELNAHMDKMLPVLMDFHASVEQAVASGAPWAEAANRQIWAFYEDYVKRRVYKTVTV